MEDQAELEQLMRRLLCAVSSHRAEKQACGELHELFVEDGKLIKTTSTTSEISTVDEFIRHRQETLDNGALQWFQEVEVAHITEIFGNVTHRFSTSTPSTSGVWPGPARNVPEVAVYANRFMTPDGPSFCAS